jgi:general secretion pathway protein L
MAWLNDLHVFRWYGERLGRLFPARDPRVLVAHRTRTEIRLSRDGAVLYRKQKLARPIDEGNRVRQHDTAAGLLPLLKRGEKFVLSLSDTRCFTHEMSLPSVALSDADRILEIETGRLTPFEKGDVYRIWYPAPGTTSTSRILHNAVVKKTVLREINSANGAPDSRLSAIAIRPDDHAAWPCLIDASGQPFGSKREASWKKLSAALVFAALALAGSFYWSAVSRLDQTNTAFATGIEELDAKAKAVRDKIDGFTAGNLQTKALADLRQSSFSVVKTWDEITRLTPDSAWLQNLSITGGQVQIDGLATDAEKMIATLEASKMFRNVRFASPVFNNPADNKQRFSIVLEFEGPT